MNGKGIVIKTSGDRATVRVTVGAECAACPSKHHCHGEAKPRDIVVINDSGARVSDHVFFEADPWKMVFSAALIWILPVLSMIVGYIVADRIAGGIVPIVSAFVFLGGSFAVLKVVDRLITGGRTFYPKISRILASPDDLNDFNKECH